MFSSRNSHSLGHSFIVVRLRQAGGDRGEAAQEGWFQGDLSTRPVSILYIVQKVDTWVVHSWLGGWVVWVWMDELVTWLSVHLFLF